MKITFYQRDNTIYSRVCHKSEMIRITTGIRVPKHVKFLPTRERFKGDTPDVPEMNADLDRQRAIISDLFAKHGSLEIVKKYYSQPMFHVQSDEPTFKFAQLCNKYIDGITNGAITTKAKTKFRISSIRTYQFATTTYWRFVAKNKDIDLRDYDLSGKELAQKREIADNMSKHFDKFVAYMIDNDFQINTRADVMTIIMVILAYWERDLFLTLPKPNRVAGYETPIITLPTEFAKALVMDSHKKYEKMDQEMRFLWEISATMLVTSLRISDALTLSKDDIVFVDGEAFLTKENLKTGTETTTPLPRVLSERYAYNINHHGNIYTPLPYHPMQCIRKGFKSFFAQYPEMHELVTYKRADIIGRKVAVTQKYYEIVHPHMLRKTAVTMLISNGVSIDHVRFITGHKSDAINRYIGWVDKTYKTEVKQYYNKVYNEDTTKA